MPVSKKRPRKKSAARTSKDKSKVLKLPDQRAMEGILSAIGGRQANNATAKAQQVMYDAWDQTNPRKRVSLAHKALSLSPLCADAYVLLAEQAAHCPQEA